MKQSILILTALVFIASHNSSFSQEAETPQTKVLSPAEHAKKKTAKMKEQLELSDKQEKELYQVNLDHEKANEIIRKEKEALKAKQKALRSQHKVDVEKVLTADQRVKLEEIMKAKHAKKCKKERSNTPPPPPPPPTK